jgi:exonuclease III
MKSNAGWFLKSVYEHPNLIIAEAMCLSGQPREKKKIFVTSVYVPGKNHAELRLNFQRKLAKKIRKLQVKGPVVLMGDMNMNVQSFSMDRP